MGARRGRGNASRQVSRDLCLAPSNLGRNRVWLVRDILVARLVHIVDIKQGVRKLVKQAVASHPPSRRPVGTGQLPVSGRETVRASLLSDLLTESLSKRLTTL